MAEPWQDINEQPAARAVAFVADHLRRTGELPMVKVVRANTGVGQATAHRAIKTARLFQLEHDPTKQSHAQA